MKLDPYYKKCSRCDIIFPVTEFRISKKGYYRSCCKKCLREKYLIYKTKYPERSKEVHRKNQFRRHYGITIEDYNLMFLKQEGKCAICGTHQSQLSNTLSVDHCHETNIVRGLLCDKCNRGIGHFNDNPNLLINAANYLSINGQKIITF